VACCILAASLEQVCLGLGGGAGTGRFLRGRSTHKLDERIRNVYPESLILVTRRGGVRMAAVTVQDYHLAAATEPCAPRTALRRAHSKACSCRHLQSAHVCFMSATGVQGGIHGTGLRTLITVLFAGTGLHGGCRRA